LVPEYQESHLVVSVIKVSSDSHGEQRISGWQDSSVAIIIWRAETGGTHQKVVTDEREAISLMESIEADERAVLISADFAPR
jgi:hypothetical protein